MLTDLIHVLELDRHAIAESSRVTQQWQPAAGDPLTPCAGWRLGDLVAHMTVQQHGFARAVAGEVTGVEEWEPLRHDDPVTAYAASCDEVAAAFERVPEQPDVAVYLPEISADPLPVLMVVNMHLVDNVVHAWDVARALDVPMTLGDDVVAAALEVARIVPDDENRDATGAAFAHRRAVPPGASALDETLLLLGRDPVWRPSGV